MPADFNPDRSLPVVVRPRRVFTPYRLDYKVTGMPEPESFMQGGSYILTVWGREDAQVTVNINGMVIATNVLPLTMFVEIK